MLSKAGESKASETWWFLLSLLPSPACKNLKPLVPSSGFSNYCNLIRLATKKMTCIHTECFFHIFHIFHMCFSEYAIFFLAFISFKFLKNPVVQKIGNTCYRKCTASVCSFLVQTPCSKPNLKFLLY